MPDHREHRYNVVVQWTGNRGTGTADYRAYDRAHEIGAPGKPSIPGSADPQFRGDPERWNPEELLVASLSACHKLWYLHLAASAGIVVTDYVDSADGIMVEDETGGGHFARVVLRPRVTVTAESDVEAAQRLHDDAHAKCFIANSVNFPVDHEPVVVRDSEDA